MRQSQLFTKTRREAPKDEVAKNAQLLIRAGYIHKEMAGVYAYLPLGLRVLEKISDIIRGEMNAIGGQEVLLTALQDPELWKKTDRWSDENVDAWFKTALKSKTELGLGFTHEEPLTQIMRDHISSYRDLPAYPYQIQTKFRNELRSKSGIMRGREFLMKDMYSFSASEEQFRAFYEQAAEAYMRIFAKVGLGDVTFRTFASGGSFSRFSDEFQTLSDAGEDTIYLSRDKNIAVNKEVYTEETLNQLELNRDELEEVSAIEVGNIFPLGTRFSEALGLMFKDEGGKERPVVMGSYGLGPTRLMGTIVEVLADDKGIVWPEALSPFSAHLVALSDRGGEVMKEAERLYADLTERGVEILFDDRDIRAGEKFADADLLGIPVRLIVSEKSLSEGGVEKVDRATGASTVIPESAAHELFAGA